MVSCMYYYDPVVLTFLILVFSHKIVLGFYKYSMRNKSMILGLWGFIKHLLTTLALDFINHR